MLLSKEEQKQVRKNLREYSREFEEEDKYAVDIANTAIVEMRKRVLNEWAAWVRREKELLEEEREELGLGDEADLYGEGKKDEGEDETCLPYRWQLGNSVY